MSEYGYLNHTSTERRDEEAIAAMFRTLPSERITIEQMWSPGERRRPAFETLLGKVEAGDTLYVHSVDRLGFDAAEVVKVWRTVTQEKQAAIVVLDSPWLNSRENERLTISQVRRAAQRAFDDVRRAAEGSAISYAAFTLVDASEAGDILMD